MIETFDRATVKEVRTKVSDALEALAAENGLTVEVRGGSFDPHVGTYSPKVTFRVEGSAEAEFATAARLLGLDAADYGRVFEHRMEEYKITGINLRARKFPITVERVRDGKSFKFPETIVRGELDKAA